MHDLSVLFNRVRRGMLFTAVLGAAAALTACGGGGDGEVAPAPAPGPVPAAQPAGTLSLVAGAVDGSPSRAIDGPGPVARFNLASGVAADGRGNVYVVDTVDSTIRKIAADNQVSTLAGSNYATGSVGVNYANFAGPGGMTIDAAGNTYVTDGYPSCCFILDFFWNRVRKVTPEGQVTTLPLPGPEDFRNPILGPGISVDAAGNVYVLRSGAIRKFTQDGAMTNITAPEVSRAISSLAVDKAGNVYFGYQNTIRKIVPGQAEVVLAGSGTAGYADGAGDQARFDFAEYAISRNSINLMTSLAVDNVGNVYVADSNNFAVRRISPDGRVTTIGGRPGVQQIQLGELPGGLASPRGLALDGDKTLYVTTSTAVLRIDLR